MDMRLVALALVPVLAACGGSSPQGSRPTGFVQQSSAEAERLCRSAADGYDGEVVAAFAMTVHDVRVVMPTAPPGGADNYPDGWQSLDGDVAAAKCYIDADIAKAPPPPAEGTPEPSFDRTLLFAATGVDAAFFAAGYRDNLKPEPPTEDASPPPTAVTPSPGEARLTLYTHCGIREAEVKGLYWRAHPPLGNGNPPSGWGNPETSGRWQQTSETTAVFIADSGVEASFVRAEPPAVQSGCG